MSARQQIIWTVCSRYPNAGGRRRGLAISLHAALQVQGNASGALLEVAPRFADWPTTLREGIDWSRSHLLWTGADGKRQTLALRADLGPVQPKCWRAVFPRDCPVIPRDQDKGRNLAQEPICGLPLAAILRSLQAIDHSRPLLAAIIGSGHDHNDLRPSWRTALRALGGPWVRKGLLVDAITTARAAMLPPQAPQPDDGSMPFLPSDGPMPGVVRLPAALRANLPDHLENLLLHLLLDSPPDQTPPDQPIDTPRDDFHARLAYLSDHPALLRHLGLVIDATADDALPEGDGFLQFVPAWRADDLVAPTVRTAMRRTDAGLVHRAAADDHDHQAGFLRLDDQSRYQILQRDVTHESRLLLSEQLSDASADPGGTSHALGGVPTIVREDRAALVHRRLLRAASLDADLEAGEATFWAEDLVCGYRVDVQRLDTGTSPWRSLCRRQGSYRDAQGDLVVAVDDEGLVRDLADERSYGAEGPVPAETCLVVSEALCSWDGWSLVTNRPGTPLDRSGDALAEPPISTALGLHSSFSVPAGGLPQLREGATYRYRVRTVDIAGNSRLPEDADDRFASAPTPFIWLGPAPAPLLVGEAQPGAGETAARLVIRSDTRDPARPQLLEHPERSVHLAPERGDPRQAERLGLLDPASGHADTRHWRRTYRLLQQRTQNEGGLPQEVARGQRLNLKEHLPDGRNDAVRCLLWPTTALDLPITTMLRTIVLLGTDYDLIPDTESVDNTVAIVAQELRPISDGPQITIEGLDLAPLLTYYRDGTAWPQARSPVIRLSAWQPRHGSELVAWNETLAELDIRLPAAGQLTALLAEEEEMNEALRFWAEVVPDTAAIMPSAVIAHPAPHRRVELVHAVSHPLTVPQVTGFDFRRDQPGQVAAQVTGSWLVDVASTGLAQLHLSWREYRDAPEDPAGYSTSTLLAMPVNDAIDDRLRRDHSLPPAPINDHADCAIWPDTRHRAITVTPRAVSRFADDFLGTDFEGSCHRDGASWTTHLLATTPPAKPAVAFIGPAFSWRAHSPSPQLRRLHRGGGVVLEIEPPWFTSGEGEQLVALFLRPGAEEGPATSIASIWGRDPADPSAWITGADRRHGRYPRLSHIDRELPEAGTGGVIPPARLALFDGSDIHLDQAGANLDLQPLRLDYDHERRRWIATMPLDIDRHAWPFLRLAVARLQEHAIPGCQTSEVVFCDFIQVAPERLATLLQLGPGSWRITLQADADETLAPTDHRIVVRVHRRRRGTGEAAWVDISDADSTSFTWPQQKTPLAILGQVDLQLDQMNTIVGEYRLEIQEQLRQNAVPDPLAAPPAPVGQEPDAQWGIVGIYHLPLG